MVMELTLESWILEKVRLSRLASKPSGSSSSSGATSLLMHHMKILSGDKKHKCQYCGKDFLQLSHMRQHLRTHVGGKDFKCDHCPKAFRQKSHLLQHMRMHTGDKKYTCEICQRKFTQLSHLQQHIRTHTGDKPYKCSSPGCPKAFSQLSNLQSHSRTHQADKPYKCNACYKCFADELSLLEHIPKHKESKHLKTHICRFCGKSYTQEAYLSKHMSKHADKAAAIAAPGNNKKSGGHSSSSSLVGDPILLPSTSYWSKEPTQNSSSVSHQHLYTSSSSDFTRGLPETASLDLYGPSTSYEEVQVSKTSPSSSAAAMFPSLTLHAAAGGGSGLGGHSDLQGPSELFGLGTSRSFYENALGFPKHVNQEELLDP